MVEQRTFNPFVVGSTPARPTTQSKTKKPLAVCKGLFGFSNPSTNSYLALERKAASIFTARTLGTLDVAMETPYSGRFSPTLEEPIHARSFLGAILWVNTKYVNTLAVVHCHGSVAVPMHRAPTLVRPV